MDRTLTPERTDAAPLGLAPGREPPPPLRLLQRWTPSSVGPRAAPAAAPAGPWWSRWWARPDAR